MYLRLQSFDGPLDLLLHLIKAQEINIFNIPISKVAEQFQTFVTRVPFLDFLEAGEYLAMAAQLLEIKANMLLPAMTRPGEDAQSLDDIPEDDPRRPLVQQLLDFEMMKHASAELERMKILGRDVFPSGEFLRQKEAWEELAHPIKGNAFDLVVALEKALLRFSESQAAPRVRVRAQKITIEAKMRMMRARFQYVDSLVLLELFLEAETRYELIVVFMAVLELCKANELQIEQDEMFGEIRVSAGPLLPRDLAQVDVPLPVVEA